MQKNTVSSTSKLEKILTPFAGILPLGFFGAIFGYNIKGLGVDFNLLVGQIRREIELKHIKPVQPEHFMINLVSLCMFPFLARPVIMGLTGFDQEKFNAFIAERKMEIPRLILQSIHP